MSRTFKDRKKNKPTESCAKSRTLEPQLSQHYLNFKRRGASDGDEMCPYCGGITDIQDNYFMCSECGWVDTDLPILLDEPAA